MRRRSSRIGRVEPSRVRSPARRPQRAPAQVAHVAHCRGHRRRDRGLRVVAHSRRRLVRRREREFLDPARDPQRGLAGVSDADHLRAEDPPGRRGRRASRGRTGSAAST